MSNKLRILVLGYIIRGPIGGMSWDHLHYILGLRALGHDVYFVEDSDDYPSCYDPSRHVTDTDPSYGIKFISKVFDRYGIGDRWAYYDAHQPKWIGPLSDRVHELGYTADLLLNLSGVNPIRDWFSKVPIRVFIDTDPTFTQLRNLSDATALKKTRLHTDFFTIGENINRPEGQIPDDGIPWQKTRHPIFLDEWPQVPGKPSGKFTTVMQWESYPSREFHGRSYGQKSDSFLPFLDFTSQLGSDIELAIGGSSAPRERLLKAGWLLRNPLEVTLDPWTYQDYIHQSKAEFSVAKHGYVVSNSGWFSERSGAYLASGRPVVIQDTGFSDWLETGSGVIPFSSMDEAKSGIESVNSRYDFHCITAREVAAEYFESERVLTALIDSAMN